MKGLFLIMTILAFITSGIPLHGQYLSLSYPKYNSVMQRDVNNQAAITIAGQLVYGTGQNGAIAPGTVISYRITTLSVTPNTQTQPVSIVMATNGMFYTTLTLSKGWYLIEVMLNGAVYASSKVGVGDVFFIAGQSNAQGVPSGGANGTWALPNTSGFPEWITGMDADGNCTKRLPETSDNMYSLTNLANQSKMLGPTGNTVWCYAMLGKKISDANGGMPVAFFNTASGGSTVTQWYQGAQGLSAPNFYTNGNQFCLGYKGGSMNPADYYGQPYTPLKSALNYYASIYGVRAVLWHQGEADADLNVAANYKASSAQDYQNKLQFVITKSRADFGATVNPNVLSWIVSKAGISKTGPLNGNIRTGQSNTVNPNFASAGPDTDYVTGSSGTTTAAGYRKDQTHFEESQNNALTWLAGKWYDAIGNNGNRISAGFVPQLSYFPNGNKHNLLAPAGYAEYRWGSSINNPIAGANTNVFTTESCYQDVKCFIKDSKGNWHVSATTWIHCYPSNRIAAEEGEPVKNENGLMTLCAYPNPFQEEFLIEFDVPEDGSHVKLELVDVAGRVLKKIVDNPHAKGRWKYYSGKLDAGVQTMFCRLKVNDLHTIKKLIKGN